MRIVQKMQSGAAFTQYVPMEQPKTAFHWLYAAQAGAQGAAQQSAGTSSKSSGDEGLITKDMIKQLYENGLPNDVEKFLDSVDMFGNSLNSPFESSTQSYKEIIAGMAKIKQNKDMYDQAVKEARRNGILNQPAIDTDGRVFLKTKSGITKKAVSQLSNSDIQNVLSYGDLAKMRAYDPSVAFDNGFLADVISNGQSLEQIAASIQQVASRIGTTTMSRDQVGMRSAREQAAAEGIKEVMSDPEGYQFVEKRTTRQATQQDKAKIAMRYILEKMTPQQAAIIQFQAKIRNTSPEQIVADGLSFGLNDSYSEQINWQKYEDPSSSRSGSGSGSGSGKGKTYEMNQTMAIVTGDGLQHTNFVISPGKGSGYQVDAQIVSWIPKAGGQGTVGPGSAVDALLTSELGRVLDTDSMHIGGQRIDASQLSKMYYDGQKSYAMDLPVTYDRNGKPMPNWDLLDNYNKAKAEIARRGGNLSPEQVNQIFRSHGLSNYFNADGTPNRRSFMRFLGVSLLADESVFQDADDYPEWFTKVDDDYVRNRMSTELGADKRNPLKLDGDLYRGTVFVPIYDSFNNARVASGQSPWVSDPGYEQQMADEQMMYQQMNEPQVVNQLSKSQL